MDVFDFKHDSLDKKVSVGAEALANNSDIKLEHDLDKELENYLDNEDNINEVYKNIQEEDDNSSETENIDIQDDTDNSDDLDDTEEKEDTDDINKVNDIKSNSKESY